MERFDDEDPTKEAYAVGFRRIILIDFDGVLHRAEGWEGPAVIKGPPIDGALEWVQRIVLTCNDEGHRLFDCQIYSSRSKYAEGVVAMRQWLVEHGLSQNVLDELRFPADKPPAWMTIDDRAFMFRGTFPSAQYLLSFQPWDYDAWQGQADDVEFLHWLADRLDGRVISSQERRRIHRIANHLEGKHHEEMHKEPP